MGTAPKNLRSEAVKKFEFRFRAVERVREIELDRQIREMAVAQKKVQEIEAQIKSMQERVRHELDRVRKRVSAMDHLEKDMQLISADFREGIRKCIDEKRQELMLALQAVERERRKVVERKKKLQAMEKLHEREKEIYVEESKRAEMRELDEVGSTLWHRDPQS
jgi:flagellar export protein FliJ